MKCTVLYSVPCAVCLLCGSFGVAFLLFFVTCGAQVAAMSLPPPPPPFPLPLRCLQDDAKAAIEEKARKMEEAEAARAAGGKGRTPLARPSPSKREIPVWDDVTFSLKILLFASRLQIVRCVPVMLTMCGPGQALLSLPLLL